MELCYEGALVMPSSYAVMDEQEMTYVEGGGEYNYKKGDATGMNDCYGTAATLAYIAGISWIAQKAASACSLITGAISGAFSVIFVLVKRAAGYFAKEFFYAAETARGMYKKSAYTIKINTFFGVPTSVTCS